MSVEKANLPTRSDKVIAEVKSTEETYLENIKFLDKFFMLSPPEEDKEKVANVVEDKEEAAKKAAKLEKRIKAVEEFKKTPEGKAFIAELEKIKPIKKLSEDLLLKLEGSIDSRRVAEIFSEELNFNEYNQYLESYSRIVALSTSLKEKNKKFENLMAEFVLDNTRGLTFESFLIMPVQRLPRYVLLLKELKKAEEDLKKDVSTLEGSINTVQKAASVANDAVGKQADLTAWTDVLTRHPNYSSDENRELRSVRKSGDISGSFNTDTDEDLAVLKEALEKNEALEKLFNNQKITLAYAQKKPLIIQCMLDGKPLCKIAQETGKNGEKTFYVRIKTNLSTLKSGEILDYDAIKVQFDMAKAVSNVVVDMVENHNKLVSAPPQEPFDGYTKVVDEAARTDGAQTKGGDSGVYIGSDGKTYYIKCAQEKNVDDDVAEVITSRLNALAMGKERAVQYTTVYNKNNNTVYVVSQVPPGFEKIKDVVKLPIPLEKADLIFPQNKDAVYAALTPGQRKEMARVLAGSLWVRDIDPQYGNILLNTDKEDGTTPRENSEGLDTVKKFDNGWGLSRICKPKHAQVRVFERHSPLHREPVGTHGHTKIPTNHFNDYPKIIRSQDFVEALADTVKELTVEKIQEVVRLSMDEIKKAYQGKSYLETLKLFCTHISLDSTGHNTNPEDLAQYITKELTARLKDRTISLALLQRMLAIDLALQNGNIREVGRLATELQSVVYEQYKDDKGKAMLLKDILPPYDPSFDTLMESATELMKKDPSLNKDERDAISFCTDLSKKSNAEKTLAQEAPWFQKEDEGWKPPKSEPSALDPGLMHRLLATKNGLQHDHSGDSPKVTPLALPTLHDKAHVTTAKGQTPETFSTYYECLMKQLGSSAVSKSLTGNSGAIAVTSPSKMLASSKPVGATGYLITVTHSPDNSIHTDFPSISDEWKKIFSSVLKANIEAGLTSLSPSGSFEQVKYMTKEILKENLTPVFSPTTSKLLERHKDGGNTVEFLKKVRDEIEAEKSPGKSSHLTSKL